MVTGGKREWYYETDSTEIYRDSAWSVLPSAALPSPTFYLSSGKINDTIFVIGISILLKVFFFTSNAIQVVYQLLESYGLTL